MRVFLVKPHIVTPFSSHINTVRISFKIEIKMIAPAINAINTGYKNIFKGSEIGTGNKANI